MNRLRRPSLVACVCGSTVLAASGCVVLGLDFDKDGVTGGTGATGPGGAGGTSTSSTTIGVTSGDATAAASSASGLCEVPDASPYVLELDEADDTRITDIDVGDCGELAIAGSADGGDLYAKHFDVSGAFPAGSFSPNGSMASFVGVDVASGGSIVASGVCQGDVVSGECACSGGASKAYVVKTDASGDASCRWAMSFGGSSGQDVAVDVVTSGTETYVVGVLKSSPTASPAMPDLVPIGSKTARLEAPDQRDIFVARLSDPANGGDAPEVAWVTVLGGSGNEIPFAIAVDGNRLIVAGSYLSDDFAPLGGAPFHYAGFFGNGFVASLDTDGGQIVDAIELDTEGSLAPRAIALAPGGVIYVGGGFSGTVKIDDEEREGAVATKTYGFLARLTLPPNAGQTDLVVTTSANATITDIGLGMGGDVHVVGTFGDTGLLGTLSTVELEGEAVSMTPELNDETPDVFVAGLNANLTTVWMTYIDPTFAYAASSPPADPSLATILPFGYPMVAVESKGPLLVDGSLHPSGGSALVRLAADGTLE